MNFSIPPGDFHLWGKREYSVYTILLYLCKTCVEYGTQVFHYTDYLITPVNDAFLKFNFMYLGWYLHSHFLVKHDTYRQITSSNDHPKSNYSKYCRQFRKVVALAVQDLERCRHCRFWAWSFSGLSPQIRVLANISHVDRHGHFTLNQLRLSVLNETYTNSFTAGPRLFTGISLIRVQYFKVSSY